MGSILEYAVMTMIIPYPIQMSLKEWVSASLMLEMTGLILMQLRVMVTYIEFLVVFL